MDKLKILLAKGRIYESVYELLSDVGISIHLPDRTYFPTTNQEDLAFQVVKPQIVSLLLANNKADMGFSGKDWVYENGCQDDVVEIMDLGFDPVRIVAAIPEARDFDKLLKSYDTLVKIADFTPRNAKNANDFDSVGEIFRWLEKRGWKNQYFNGVTKDIVDETLHNIQAYNQRLYTNESGIGDEITERIRALQNVAEYEQKQSDFNTDEVCDDFDKYENDGYNELMKEDFDADVGVTV